MSSRDGNASSENPPSPIQVGLVALAVLVILYSVFVITQPLLGLTFATWLLGLYLLYRFLLLATRFVSAVERIADALEHRDGEL